MPLRAAIEASLDLDDTFTDVAPISTSLSFASAYSSGRGLSQTIAGGIGEFFVGSGGAAIGSATVPNGHTPYCQVAG